MSTVNTNAVTILRDFGDALRKLREAAGFTQASAVRLIKMQGVRCSQPRISNLERGDRWPDEEMLSAMFSVYGASASKQTELRAVMGVGKSIERPWFDAPRFRDLLDGKAREYFAAEDAAVHEWAATGLYPPGLLQTKRYIQAIVEYGQKYESAETRETFVEARMMRQGVLTRTHPLDLTSFVLEAALRTEVGGPEVMREQLRVLREASKRPNIVLRVIPFSAGAAAVEGSPWTLLDFAGENRSVVSREMSRIETMTDDLVEVKRAKRKFAELDAIALDEQQTIHLIEEIESKL